MPWVITAVLVAITVEEIEEEELVGCIIQIIIQQLKIFTRLLEHFQYISEKTEFKDTSGSLKIIYIKKIADHDGSVLV